MQVVNGTITFSPLHGLGPRTDTQDVTLGTPANSAIAMLAGMDVAFSHHDDHHLGNLQVSVGATMLNPTTVRVSATYGLRDWSGDWDDDYEGRILFSVVAE